MYHVCYLPKMISLVPSGSAHSEARAATDATRGRGGHRQHHAGCLGVRGPDSVFGGPGQRVSQYGHAVQRGISDFGVSRMIIQYSEYTSTYIQMLHGMYT